MAYNYKGEGKKVLEAGKKLLDFGQKHSNVRSIFLGYQAIGLSYFAAGDFPTGEEYAFRKAIQSFSRSHRIRWVVS